MHMQYCFILQNQQKKIKTESGVWISASYRTKAYQKWLKQGKEREANQSSDEDEDSGQKDSGKKLQSKYLILMSMLYCSINSKFVE